jgi:subtilisin family serine protease/recombinational DNA repair protein RecR
MALVSATGPLDTPTAAAGATTGNQSIVSLDGSGDTPPFERLGGSTVETRDTTRSSYVAAFRNASALDAALARLGPVATDVWRSGFFGFAAQMNASQVDALTRVSGLLSVEPDHEISISTTTVSTTQSNPPWGLDRIDQRSLPRDNSYTSTATGLGVTAYVIDSGVRQTHSDFTGRIPRGAYFDFGDGSGSSDCHGHGTHVAGTIGGTTHGVAKKVSIVPVKVVGCSGSTTMSIVLAGIDWVISDHLAGVPAVANLSLGGPASTTVDNAVQALIDDGVTVVVAAGNDAQSACNYSPGRLPAAITVAASDQSDHRATFSNHGSCNDLFAPGVSVLSAYNTSDTSSATISGTSMAAPHVAGAAALALQRSPAATPAQVWTAIDSLTTKGQLTACCGDPDKLLFVASAPSAPVNASGIAGDRAATVSWSAPASNGGSAITGYLVTSSSGSATCSTTGATSCVVTGLTNGTSYTFTVTAANGIGTSPPSTPSSPIMLASDLSVQIAPSLIPLSPARLVDSRPGTATIDGLYRGIGHRPAGTTTEVIVAGRGNIPADATAVALNVTVTDTHHNGYLTVYPCGTPLPNASNLNYVTGQTIPNAVITKIGTNGTVCFHTSGTTHLIVDVNAHVPATSTFSATSPARLVDSRPGTATIDGLYRGIGHRPAGTTTEVIVAGRGNIPADATAVALNVTVTDTHHNGYLTVYPCGTPLPNASNLNYVTGQTIPNAVITKIGTNGTVCFHTSGTTHLIVDVNAHVPATSTFSATSPARLVDSRPGTATIDGLYRGIGHRPAGTTTEVIVAGRGNIPADATAVALNVTVTDTHHNGYLTVYPCGTPLPNASNLNYVTGQTIPNAVITKIGTNGTVCFHTSGTTHLIVDVNAHVAAG